MDRRGFLRALAAVLAVPVVARIVNEQPIQNADQVEFVSYAHEFDPAKEYGMAIYAEMGAPIEVVKAQIISDARKYLPKGTVFEVVDGGPIDYGRTHAIAWHYRPGKWNVASGVDRLRGVHVLGLVTA